MSVEETVEMMIEILKNETELEIEIEKALRPDTLIEEIGLDSLDVINFLFLLSQKTGVEVQDDILLSDEINTIADLAAYVDRNRS
jgi:acyl carrier protein